MLLIYSLSLTGPGNLNSSAFDWLQNIDLLKESMKSAQWNDIDLSQFQGKL